MAIAVIREQLSALDARAVVAAASHDAAAGDVRAVYYPYHYFDATGSAPGLFGRRPLALRCLVDARSGEAFSSDPFAIENREVAPAPVLSSGFDAVAAEAAALRCLSHGVGRRLRTIAEFRLRLDYRGLVFKAYWLLNCGSDTVLVDSGNGAWHLLEAA